jgi:hypothetical protein
MKQIPKRPHPQYYKIADDVRSKMPEGEWPDEVVDGINKALKSAHAISEETYGLSEHSEIVTCKINVGSPWRTVSNFTGNYVGADSGTGGFASSCKYMKHYDGSVEFQGSFAGATAPGFPARWWLPHTVMTLAASVRPQFSSIFPIYGVQNNAGLQATPSYAVINAATGVLQVTGADPLGAIAASSAPSTFYLNFRYMCADPRPYEIPGFPIRIALSRKSAPVGVIPIAAVEDNENTVRPVPMVGNADWKFSKKDGKGVLTISNLSFSGFNNRIQVWFLVIYR